MATCEDVERLQLLRRSSISPLSYIFAFAHVHTYTRNIQIQARMLLERIFCKDITIARTYAW